MMVVLMVLVVLQVSLTGICVEFCFASDSNLGISVPVSSIGGGIRAEFDCDPDEIPVCVAFDCAGALSVGFDCAGTLCVGFDRAVCVAFDCALCVAFDCAICVAFDRAVCVAFDRAVCFEF